MPVLERDIERKACALVLANYHVFSVKLAKTSERGYPDRAFLLPGGRVVFIEFKRPGEGPTERQKLIHERLAYHGFPVHVCSSVKEAVEIIRAALGAAPLPAAGGEVAARKTPRRPVPRPRAR